MNSVDGFGFVKKNEMNQSERKYTILVVDDEDANRRMLQRMFKNQYEVLSAANGREALDLLLAEENPQKINLIISDQRMPVMSGLDFLKEARRIVPKAIRIILTGYSDVNVIIDSINEGHVYKFIQKPFEIHDMRITVQRALENFDLEEQKLALIESLQREVDIRKQAEKQLTRLNAELRETMEQLHLSLSRQAESEKMAALGGLVAGMTHEINTPMGISLTSASYLKNEIDRLFEKFTKNDLKRTDLKIFQEKAEEAVSIVLTNLQRAGELIKSFKQVAVDQASNENRTFDLRAYVDEIILSLKPKLKRTPHQVRIDCPPNLIIFSNPGALSQILTNFIVNSLIHGFSGIENGVIDIQFRVENGNLILIYSDNGIGMPPEHVEQIFNPFFTTRRDEGGSGIGTHIVYNLVTRSLNGTIDCESSPGKGIRFHVQIPLS